LEVFVSTRIAVLRQAVLSQALAAKTPYHTFQDNYSRTIQTEAFAVNQRNNKAPAWLNEVIHHHSTPEIVCEYIHEKTCPRMQNSGRPAGDIISWDTDRFYHKPPPNSQLQDAGDNSHSFCR